MDNTITEISIVLTNRPGRLASMSMMFEEQNINIRGISVAESGHVSIVRFVCNNPQKAIELLRSRQFLVSDKKVIGIRLKDEPGTLARVAKILGDEAINIEYVYGTLIHADDEIVVVFQTRNIDRAIEILEKNGIRLVSDSNLSITHV